MSFIILYIISILKNSYFVKTISKNQDLLNKEKIFYYLPYNKQKSIEYNIKKINKSSVTYLSISFRTCPFNSPDKYHLKLLQKVIGGFFSSRLFMILREENGLTYKSMVNTQNFENMGDFTIIAITDPKKILYDGGKKGVIPLIIKMLNLLLKEGITDSELLLTKNYIKGKYFINMENNSIQSNYNGEQLLLSPEKNIVPYDKLYDTYYKNITKKEVNEVIKKYFKKENMNVCILGENLPSIKNIKYECEKIIE